MMKTNWQTKKLGEIIELHYGKALDRSHRKPDGDFPVFGANGELGRTDKFLTEGEAIIVGRKGSAGEVTRISGKFWPSDVTYYVFGNDQIDVDYLFNFFKSVDLTQFARGVKPGINRNDVYNIEIPLPPLATQHKIVTILDEKFAKLREAKQLRQEVIGDTEKILAATLREIFEEGKEKGWEEKEMGDVLEKIVGGGTPSKAIPEYWNGDIPWASVKDLKEGQQLIEKTKDFITQEGLENSSANLIPKGALIISTRMGLGRVAKNTIDMAINQDLKALFPKKVINIDFLILVLLTKSQEIISGGKGATVSGVTLDFFRKIKILVPPLAEQQKIVTRLDALSEKLRTLRELQQSQLEDMKKLEKAYLKEAFRGQLA